MNSVKVVSINAHKKGRSGGQMAEVVIVQEGYSITRHCERVGSGEWRDDNGNVWTETEERQ